VLPPLVTGNCGSSALLWGTQSAASARRTRREPGNVGRQRGRRRGNSRSESRSVVGTNRNRGRRLAVRSGRRCRLERQKSLLERGWRLQDGPRDDHGTGTVGLQWSRVDVVVVVVVKAGAKSVSGCSGRLPNTGSTAGLSGKIVRPLSAFAVR